MGEGEAPKEELKMIAAVVRAHWRYGWKWDGGESLGMGNFTALYFQQRRR